MLRMKNGYAIRIMRPVQSLLAAPRRDIWWHSSGSFTYLRACTLFKTAEEAEATAVRLATTDVGLFGRLRVEQVGRKVTWIKI